MSVVCTVFLDLFAAVTAAATAVPMTVPATAATVAMAFTMPAAAVTVRVGMSVAMLAAAFLTMAARASLFFALALTVAATPARAVLVTVAVTTAAATTTFFVAVPVAATAATATFAMTVLMTVAMLAHGGCRFRVAFERLGHTSTRRFVGVAADTGDQLDAGSGEACHSTVTDTAANDAVNARLREGANLRAVPLTRGFDDGRADDLTVLDGVDLERGGHAEVLIDVFVLDGNGDLHGEVSFQLFGLIRDVFSQLSVLPAAAACAVPGAFAAADFVIAARYLKGFPKHERFGDLCASSLVDLGRRRSRHLHLKRTLFVRALFEIDDANGFELFHEELHARGRFRCFRRKRRIRTKAAASRFRTDTAASARSWHWVSPCNLFPTYVGYYRVALEFASLKATAAGSFRNRPPRIEHFRFIYPRAQPISSLRQGSS